jgi:Flp pilus assembly protein TadG
MIFNYKNSIVSNSKNLQRGVAVVEFAIVIIPLLLITAGIVEFGRVFWYYDALSKATRDGSRYLSKSTLLDMDETKNIVNYAVSQAKVPNFDKDKNISITCTPDCANPTFVNVSIINYSVSVGEWIPFVTSSGVRIFTVSLTPSTTMRYIP